ncbi:PIPO, partial [Costus stripe mosaic virus]
KRGILCKSRRSALARIELIGKMFVQALVHTIIHASHKACKSNNIENYQRNLRAVSWKAYGYDEQYSQEFCTCLQKKGK